jgi:SagB-type dehydrogenase family enzyme
MLPLDYPISDESIDCVIKSRRSLRDFTGQPISLRTLSRLLYLGDGVVKRVFGRDGAEWHLRTAPSGGGLYPVDLYFIAQRVDGLEPGLYFYDAREHSISQVRAGNLTDVLVSSTSYRYEVEHASACFILAGVVPRNKFKYGERAYRFMLLEAGHIAQNLLLAAYSSGIGGLPVGGFFDNNLNELLGLDGCDDIVLYLVLAGTVADPGNPTIER